MVLNIRRFFTQNALVRLQKYIWSGCQLMLRYNISERSSSLLQWLGDTLAVLTWLFMLHDLVCMILEMRTWRLFISPLLVFLLLFFSLSRCTTDCWQTVYSSFSSSACTGLDLILCSNIWLILCMDNFNCFCVYPSIWDAIFDVLRDSIAWLIDIT